MKILHCCISAFYIDHYNYQENILPRQNKIDGHEVLIIASTYTFKNNDNKQGYYTEPRDYLNEDNILVKRRKYKDFGIRFINQKFHCIDGLYDMIEAFMPDVILFHGTSSLEIKTLCRYKKNHNNVKIYIDSHADYYTSGTNLLSKGILHGLLYRFYLQNALPYIEKVFYISIGCGDFLREVYKLPEEKIEFYSLGGNLPSSQELDQAKNDVIKELNLRADNILFLQAGKFDENKKLVEMLETFKKIKNDKLIFILIGSLSVDIKEKVEALIAEDSRVRYLGWRDGNELNRYLNACDIYVQPGKVSAIAQNAICRNSVVILNNLKEYRPFVNGNGWLINNMEEASNALTAISLGKVNIDEMKMISRAIAEKFFDYKTLARRLYE